MKEETVMTQTPTWKETLTRHNTKNPQSQIEDISAQVETAAASRLHALLLARDAEMESFLERVLGVEKSPHIRLLTASIISGVWVCHNVYGMAWEDMLAFLNSTGDPDRNRLLVKRVGRAMRLLDITVKRGCLKRGEVAGIG